MKKAAGVKYGKLLLDLVLLVLLSLMYQKKVISMEFHETGGLVLCGLFLLHKALNWKWIRAVSAGIVRRKAKLSAGLVVDVLLLLAMTAVLVTGLLISKTLPTALAGNQWLRPWHYFFAALALGLAGVHLGLHAGLLQSAVWKKLPLPGRVRTAVGALLLSVVVCFGTYSLVSTQFLSWLSQPVVTISAPAGQDHAPVGTEAHVPGSGNRDGKGKGGGKGLGLGKEEVHSVSAFHVAQTAATYASILAWFAVLTGALQTALRRSRQKRAQ